MFVTFFVWKCFGLFSILVLNFKDFFFYFFSCKFFYKKIRFAYLLTVKILKMYS